MTISGSQLRLLNAGDTFYFAFYYSEGGATGTVLSQTNWWAYLLF